jgi:hypothetical protein
MTVYQAESADAPATADIITIAHCREAGHRSARARADASALVLRSQTIRTLAATLIVHGDKPWPESSAPHSG